MTTTTNQFRVIFTEETINGKKTLGTIWYNVNFFDAENIIKKYKVKEGFEILTRTITRDSNEIKNAINARFSN